MATHDVRFGGSGIPQTILPPESGEVTEALGSLASMDGPERRDAAAAVAAQNPRSIAAWAALGESADDAIESYAYFRIGYHRGLDALRQNGWRGSGYVRWEHQSNRAFLRCLSGLAARAKQIGEIDEVERIDLFLRQLEPDWAKLAPDA